MDTTSLDKKKPRNIIKEVSWLCINSEELTTYGRLRGCKDPYNHQPAILLAFLLWQARDYGFTALSWKALMKSDTTSSHHGLIRLNRYCWLTPARLAWTMLMMT